ncbi:hypothetical protein QUA81_05460 [Microcoleus sp. F6_B4]
MRELIQLGLMRLALLVRCPGTKILDRLSRTLSDAPYQSIAPVTLGWNFDYF